MNAKSLGKAYATGRSVTGWACRPRKAKAPQGTIYRASLTCRRDARTVRFLVTCKRTLPPAGEALPQVG